MSDNTVEGPKEAVQRRLREARAKTSSFEEENREKEELRELERKVRFEENKARDLPCIQKAEEEHGEIRAVNTPLGAIVVKCPGVVIFQRFVRAASSEKGTNEVDIWRLVKPCIVYPDTARALEITEEYPGVAIKLGSKVIELGNGEVEEAEGK